MSWPIPDDVVPQKNKCHYMSVNPNSKYHVNWRDVLWGLTVKTYCPVWPFNNLCGYILFSTFTDTIEVTLSSASYWQISSAVTWNSMKLNGSGLLNCTIRAESWHNKGTVRSVTSVHDIWRVVTLMWHCVIGQYYLWWDNQCIWVRVCQRLISSN